MLGLALLAIAVAAGLDLMGSRSPISIEWLVIGTVVIAAGLGIASMRDGPTDE
jgi:hypothetical protein